MEVFMAGAERNRTERELTLQSLEKPLASLDDLAEACPPMPTARLWATCR